MTGQGRRVWPLQKIESSNPLVSLNEILKPKDFGKWRRDQDSIDPTAVPSFSNVGHVGERCHLLWLQCEAPGHEIAFSWCTKLQFHYGEWYANNQLITGGAHIVWYIHHFQTHKKESYDFGDSVIPELLHVITIWHNMISPWWNKISPL